MQTMLVPGAARRATLSAAAKRCATRCADKNSFLLRELSRHPQGIVTRYGNDLVDMARRDGVFGQLRNEVRRPALHQMRAETRMARGRAAVRLALLGNTAAQHLRVIGFGTR